MIKLKRTVKIPLIIVASLIGLIVLLAVIAPPIAKWYVEKHSKEICNRVVTMDKFKANIFTGRAKIIGFNSLEENDKDVFLTFDTLSVKINLFKLISKEVRINEIRLINPNVPILQNGPKFNFSDIINHFKRDKPKDTTKSEWIVNLKNITLRNGNIIYEDLQRNSHFGLKELGLFIPGLYFGPENSNMGVHLKFDDGGDLGVQLTYSIEEKSFNLNVDLKQFSIASVQPYAQEFLNINKLDGRLYTQLHAKGNTEHIAEMVIDGNVMLKNVDIDNIHNENMAQLKTLQVVIDTIDLKNNSFTFDTIKVDGLHVNFAQNAEYNTFSNLVKSKEERTKEQQDKNSTKETDTETASDDTTTVDSEQKTPVTFLVKNLALVNSDIEYSNNTMKRPLSLPVKDINITSKNFNLKNTSIVDLKATLPTTGTLMAHWEGLLDGWKSHKLRLRIANFDMKQISPICEHYMAYPVTAGIFAFNTNANVSNGQLDTKNEIDIHGCRVDKKMQDIKPEFNIPLRAGLFVLSDRNDDIKFDLPIKGDITSPEFSLKKLIFKALGTFLVKIATGPIDLLANAFGLTPDDFADISYQVFDMDFSSSQYTQLNKMAEAMKVNESLSLVIGNQVNLDQSIQELSLFSVKRDYYFSKHPDKNMQNMEASDFEAIKNIKNTDKDFTNYLNERSQLNNGNIYEKAAAVYPRELMENMAKKSNEHKIATLKKFFYETHGFNAEKISFEDTDFTSTNSKNTFSFTVNYTPSDSEIDAGKE